MATKRKPASKRGGRQRGHPATRTSKALGREDRFTETREQYVRRLRRDRVLGVAGLVAAVSVLLLNLVMEFAPRLRLLPGGHSELYFIAGVVAAGWSAWVAFDLGMSWRKRR